MNSPAGEQVATVDRRPYRLRQRAETAAATRRRIIDAAWELISAGGFHPVSLEEVAQRARSSRPSVYRLFGSKRELFEAVMWDRLSRARLDRLNAARELPDPIEATRTFIAENCRLFGEVGEALRQTIDVAREDPEVAHLVEIGYYGRRIQSLEHLASRLSREGCLASGWTRRQVVDSLMIVTSLDTFEVLTGRRGHTTAQAAKVLWQMARAFVRTCGE